MKKTNLIAKALRTKKFRPKIIKAKKGKGSFKRKK
jgi:stalled ribosome alternative rescue factor ArfA